MYEHFKKGLQGPLFGLDPQNNDESDVLVDDESDA